eukprot:1141440-Amorphochlora_amoeboformis.AAC.2
MAVSGPDADLSLSQIRVLRRLALTSIGPYGRPKLVHLHPSNRSVRVANSSDRIFTTLPIHHPILRSLLSTALAHKSHRGDGGLSLVALTCSLMEAVRISPLPLHSLLHSLHSALSQTLHYLRSSSCACSIPVDWTDPRVPLGLAHASITPSCGPRASPELVRVAARAFLLSFPDRQSLDHHSPVRILTISSRTPLSVHSSLGRSRAQLLDCIVVDIPLPAGALTSRSGPLTTLIYTANLDFKDYLTDTAVSRTLELSSIAAVSDGENKKGTSKASAAWTASSVQISEMDRLVDTWRNNRIDVVASQRRMHPYIITRLLASGITPIQRLSKRWHIGAFERVSGAKAIGNFLGEGFKGRMGKVAGYMQAIVGERRNLLVFPMQDVGQ